MHETTPETDFWAEAVPVQTRKRQAKENATQAHNKRSKSKTRQPGPNHTALDQHATSVDQAPMDGGAVGEGQSDLQDAGLGARQAAALATGRASADAATMPHAQHTRSRHTSGSIELTELAKQLNEALDKVNLALFRRSAANHSPSTRTQVVDNAANDRGAQDAALHVLANHVNNEEFPVMCSQFGTQEFETTRMNRCSVCLTDASTHVFQCGHPVCTNCVERLVAQDVVNNAAQGDGIYSGLEGCALCNTKDITVISLHYVLE